MTEHDEHDAHDTIRYEQAGPVATLTLHRPDRMNAMTNGMVREVRRRLGRVAEDPSVRILVLTGAGRAFCPGADIQGVVSGSGADVALEPDDFRVPALLHEMPAVTVAAVNGACAGAGMGWAMACDVRIAARSARFNTAFLDVGVAGDMALPWVLPRLIGAAKARELCFLPGKIDADEALRIGLVHRVADDDAFPAEVTTIVDRLAGFSPAALRTLKENFLDAERLSLDDFAVLEAQRHLGLFRLADTREAFAARAEGRPPRFTGS